MLVEKGFFRGSVGNVAVTAGVVGRFREVAHQPKPLEATTSWRLEHRPPQQAGKTLKHKERWKIAVQQSIRRLHHWVFLIEEPLEQPNLEAENVNPRRSTHYKDSIVFCASPGQNFYCSTTYGSAS